MILLLYSVPEIPQAPLLPVTSSPRSARTGPVKTGGILSKGAASRHKAGWGEGWKKKEKARICASRPPLQVLPLATQTGTKQPPHPHQLPWSDRKVYILPLQSVLPLSGEGHGQGDDLAGVSGLSVLWGRETKDGWRTRKNNVHMQRFNHVVNMNLL